MGEPVSAVLQSRDPAAPPFAYVKGGGGLFKDMGEIYFPLSVFCLRSSFACSFSFDVCAMETSLVLPLLGCN